MSIRVLFEINNDRINLEDISRRDLANAAIDPEARERLRTVGVTYLGERHHSGHGYADLTDWKHTPSTESNPS